MTEYKYRVVRGWTTAGTLEKIKDHEKDGWEVVTVYPRFVLLIPLFVVGENCGLVGVLRKQAMKMPLEVEWNSNTPSDMPRKARQS